MPQVLLQTTVPVVQKLAGQVKDVLSTHTKETEDGTCASTGPTTTVFVGNISEKASDMLVRQLLAVSDCCIIRTSINYYYLFVKVYLDYKFGLCFVCRNVVWSSAGKESRGLLENCRVNIIYSKWIPVRYLLVIYISPHLSSHTIANNQE